MIGNKSDMKRKSFVVFVALALLCSCNKDSVFVQNTIVGDDVITSLEDIEIPCVGGGFTLAFTSEVPWTVDGCPDWLSLSKTSGNKGTAIIKFSASVNDYRQDREANLVFKAKDGSFSTPFNISQTFPYLKVSADTLSFGWTSAKTTRPEVDVKTQTSVISISSNVNWKFEEVSTKSADVDLDKFALSAMSGEGDRDVEFIPITDNHSPAPYDLKLRLYAVMTGPEGDNVQIPVEAADEFTIKLHQDNLFFLVNDSSYDSNVEIGELNDDENNNLSVKSEVEWEVSDCPDWVIVDKSAGNGETTINIKADGVNPFREVRSGVLRLNTEAGAYRDINISQRGYALEADQTSVYIANEDLTDKIINLKTSGPWEITDVPSWLDVSPLAGPGSAEITVKAKKQNFNLENISSELKIFSTLNELYEGISIDQQRFLFDLEADPELSDLPTLKKKSYHVNFVSSGKWEILGKPDWLDISQINGDKGETSFTIGPNSGNPDTKSDRKVELTFVSIAHRDRGISVTKQLTVKQRKYTFDITGNNWTNIPAYDDSFNGSTSSSSSSSSTKYSISVDCSVDWKISSCPDWLTPNVTSGDGTPDIQVVFTPHNNTQKSSRSAKVVITSELNNDKKEFYATQDAFVFNEEDKSFNVPVMNTDSYVVTFDLTSGVPWTIQSGYSSWTNPSVKSGKGTGSITFTPEINTDQSSRTGKVVIYCALSNEQKTITFNQDKYEFNSSAKTVTFTDTPSAPITENVICSGNWKVESSADWLAVSASTSRGNGTVTFTAKNNTAETSRSTTVTVTSTDNTSLKKVFTVNQDKHEKKKK